MVTGRPNAGPGFVDLERPHVIEVAGDVGRLDVVRGIEAAVVVIDAIEVVADHEQGAARCDGTDERIDGVVAVGVSPGRVSAEQLHLVPIPPVPVVGTVAGQRGDGERGVLVHEVGIDDGADAAALGGSLEDLAGDVGDVAGGVDTRDRGGAAVVGLDHLAHTHRRRNRGDAEVGEQTGSGDEARSDDHSLVNNGPAVGETDAVDLIVVNHDSADRTVLDPDATGGEPGAVVGDGARSLVEDHRHPIRQLAEQERLVHREWPVAMTAMARSRTSQPWQ